MRRPFSVKRNDSKDFINHQRNFKTEKNASDQTLHKKKILKNIPIITSLDPTFTYRQKCKGESTEMESMLKK